MNITVQDDTGEAVLVQLSGKITQRDVSPFTEPLGDALGEEPYSKRVLLDMQEVEVLDSSGVSWLLACHKRFRNAGGSLVLHSLSSIALNVLKVLNLHHVLTIAESKEAALRTNA